MYIFQVLVFGLFTCVTVNIIKEQIYKYDIKNIKYAYKVGDNVVVYQKNCNIDRVVGCRILSRMHYTKFKLRDKPVYKVKAFTNPPTVWTIGESDIACTELEFGYFPRYDIGEVK